MTDITQNNVAANLSETGVKVLFDRITRTTDSLYVTSKEKYERKAKLIEEAEDMNTKEKLEAMDQNYDRHNQEVLQGVVRLGMAILIVVCITSGNTTVIKVVRHLVA